MVDVFFNRTAAYFLFIQLVACIICGMEHSTDLIQGQNSNTKDKTLLDLPNAYTNLYTRI